MLASLLRFRRPLTPLALVTVAAALILGTAGCSKAPEAPPAARPVLVQKAVPVSAIEQDVYSGEIRARYETDLGFRIGGKIVARLVDVGVAVKKGQVLARLDPADVQQQAESSKALVAAAMTDRDFTKAELARFQSLYDQKFISRATLEAKENAFNAASAKLKQALSQLNLAQNQTSYAVLVADQDGVVTATPAEMGMVVAPGTPVVRVARPEEKEVVVAVPEARIGQLRDAQQMLVRLWAEPDKVYQGRLREIAPNADAATRTFTAKITVLNAPAEVRLGMTANVLLGAAEQRAVFALPLTSIYHQQNGDPAVWVVDPQSSQVQLRPVKIGQYREQVVILDAGVKAGELVVTAGVHKLKPGQVVKSQESAATPAGTAGQNSRAGVATWAAQSVAVSSAQGSTLLVGATAGPVTLHPQTRVRG